MSFTVIVLFINGHYQYYHNRLTMCELPKKLNFILIAQQSWEEKNTGSNIWDMAQALAKHHHVLLVNPALDWSAQFGEGVKRQQARQAFIDQHGGKHLVELQANFWLLNPRQPLGSFNWLPDSALYDWLNQRNGKRLVSDIQSALDQLGWPEYILINDNDMLRGFYLKELLKPALYVYYLRDNLMAIDYWHRHGGRLEPLLMGKVDLVASNSTYLATQAARYNPHSVYIGQGCDLTLFNADTVPPEPDDMARIPRPRIGYAGALTTLRLDAALIETIALKRPDWQIVLMGSVDESFPEVRLQALANITFLPAKPMSQVPMYLANMDVLINPQILNEVTIGNYPRKIDEYLAMGKPVVAVKTDAMSLFDTHVFLAETADEFITGIENALAGQERSSAAARTAFALSHTWEQSVGLLTDRINALLNSPVTQKLSESENGF